MPKQGPLETLHDLTAETLLPRRRSVLIVEDNLAFAQVICLFLERHSFDVMCVSNGVEGVHQVLERDFDIIVCDLSMPNIPGDKFYFAVDRARKRMNDRFIFMTGSAEDPRWSGFLSRVTSPFLEKPFGLDDLLSTMQTLLTAIELNSA
jgi:two-component system copper resistance phosphate regulon response regulator CusR